MSHNDNYHKQGYFWVEFQVRQPRCKGRWHSGFYLIDYVVLHSWSCNFFIACSFLSLAFSFLDLSFGCVCLYLENSHFVLAVCRYLCGITNFSFFCHFFLGSSNSYKISCSCLFCVCSGAEHCFGYYFVLFYFQARNTCSSAFHKCWFYSYSYSYHIFGTLVCLLRYRMEPIVWPIAFLFLSDVCYHCYEALFFYFGCLLGFLMMDHFSYQSMIFYYFGCLCSQ